jgi:thioredoxin reductase
MDKFYDYVVLGAGPAGLQIGYYLKQTGREFVILERNSTPGEFFKKFPRHGYLISINKVFTGVDDPELQMRWDWNSLLSENGHRMSEYSEEYFPKPDALYEYLVDYAERNELPIQYGTQVVKVQRPGEHFELIDADGTVYQAKVLVVATGVFKENIPDIPGIELSDTYASHSVDPADYREQRVLIIGKGNSGFETANNLIGTAAVIHMVSPESIRMAWETHFVGHLRAVNNDFLDTYQLKSQNAIIDGDIDWIKKENGKYRVHISYSHAMGQTTEREYDRVISCAGFRFDNSIYDVSCKPELAIHKRFPAQTTAWESVNVPDMYFAGTIMQACDYKKTMSAFIHGFRHNIRALSWILAERYEGETWPHAQLAAKVDTLVDKIITRVNRGAGIFQQPGFLSDVLVVDEEDGTARYYDEVRIDHLPNSFLSDEGHYYVISLEYGRHPGSIFNVERDPDPMAGEHAFYLHPIIRRYAGSELIAEHHINDDLENQWDGPEYVEPITKFIAEQLQDARVKA